MRDNLGKTKNATIKSKRSKAAGIVSQAAKIRKVAKFHSPAKLQGFLFYFYAALLLMPSDLQL